jgi:hypothetical protein
VLESYQILIARVVIVPAENPNGICTIGPWGIHREHEASDHRLVNGRFAGFFIRLPLMKLHYYWRGNWSGLVHSELRRNGPNEALLMDVDSVMLLIGFDVHAEIEGDTSEIIHPEPLLYLVLDLPHHALVSNDKAIIDVQNDHRNDYVLILNMEHEQSSVDT